MQYPIKIRMNSSNTAETRGSQLSAVTYKKGATRPFCCVSLGGSALRELERATRFRLAVLLALHHAGVAGEEAAALEHAAQVRLVIGQRLRQAVTHGPRLPGQAAARDR